MEKEARSQIYAFLSRVMADVLDLEAVKELKSNRELLSVLGEGSVAYFDSKDAETLQEELNVDFTSVFIMNSHPVEQAVVDNSDQTLIGLENPVMQFYRNYGYQVNLNATHVMAPDHISIELGFMQNLVEREEFQGQEKFLRNHLMVWMPPYFLGVKGMAETPFYRELCDFAAEFLVSDYAALKEGR